MPESPHRIALFLGYLGGGGADQVMLNLARGLVDRNFEVDLVLGHAWGPHLWKIPSQVRVVDLKAPQVIPSVFALAEYLRREQPTVLLSALHYANEVAIWAKRLSGASTPIIVAEHNTLSQAISNQKGIRKRLIPFFVKHFYPWADKVVTVSHGAAADLAAIGGFPQERVQVIYNPVITPELLEMSREPVEHPWFKPGEPPVILGVGKLEAQKDFPTLIRAFAQVRQLRPCRLVILGWGPDRPQLESLVKELGVQDDVDLPGYIENPYAYMRRAAVFALSSAWEGLPTVLIEAMAVGIPVVSTDCKSGPEEILDHGNYGILTSVGDSSALAEAVLAVLSGKVQAVDPSWLEQFTLESATQQYLNTFAMT